MRSAAWPGRLIPRRDPPVWRSALVTVVALAAAIAARAAVLGAENGFGFSATYFPALIFITLYAGARWGWFALASSIGLAFLSRVPFPSQISREGVLIMYAASAAITVAVAAALREAIIRLDEARRRQRAFETALDRTETPIGRVYEAGLVGLYEWDIATGKGVWSPTLYRNLGVDPSVKPSVAVMQAAIHPDDRDQVLAPQRFAAAIKSGRIAPNEFRAVWPDGSVHWLLSRGEIIRDETGRAVRVVGVNMDVTERRLAFEQLAESEARFRAMADSAPVLISVSGQSGEREFVNQAYAHYLGEAFETALTLDWAERLHPDDRERLKAERAAGEAAGKVYVMEARYRRGDGEHRWIRWISQPRGGPAGASAGFIGVGIDVTDAKRAERDLLSINDLLAERVQAALAERDNAEAALHRAQKLEAVGQLTGGVAHDFNNLLTVVIGALDLIQRHPGDAARRDRMIEAALGAARRGERLTQQLLAFARRQNLKPEALKIDDLLNESEPLLRRAVGEAVSFSLSPNAPGAVVLADPSQFEAALMNLVVNARDAVTGGGAIRVESIVCRLEGDEVEEVPAGDYLCVAVHDTGVGMDAAVMSRVFEPFFTTKDVGKGTGLGLSQIYGFARQSGGGVSIDSAPGKGASVRIYLPLAQAPEPQAAAGPAVEEPAAQKGSTLDVLLVEDDVAVGDLVAAMLEDFGHAVKRAENAEGALAILRRPETVDLLLTDVVMPGGMSGVDLAHHAAAMHPALPIILSSGYTGEALSSAAAGPWPLLRKPYSSEDLAQAIEAVLDAATEPA